MENVEIIATKRHGKREKEREREKKAQRKSKSKISGSQMQKKHFELIYKSRASILFTCLNKYPLKQWPFIALFCLLLPNLKKMHRIFSAKLLKKE